ncbi:phosphoenolpyruvate--protein phosphotransferase [Comamonas sp. NLF-1-9]|uniref:phosphoenolpyruvate--protein phosphotransferase n=1 Tax=Comamonas sp. NLF-1-9 TaxID=2853163 RepID=UPI001C4883B9|nr:phosphoenolpyruvate--protein phosphotransferase [Comamonas sp. NLF-1-9]QXL84326.1 phosphoenolpyruvate--protein phosphotransferase [Comamonas sp. NLF-1-9]
MGARIKGLSVTPGIAQGRAVLIQRSAGEIARYRLDGARREAELARLAAARDAVVRELQALQTRLPQGAPMELAALLDVHLQLLHDEALVGAIRHWISDHGYNAEWALATQMEVLARQFDAMDDPYLRERKADLEQVVERLLHHLNEGLGIEHLAGSDEPRILIARDLSPADLLHYRDGVFAGFATDMGTATSHTTIVARSMGIPAVVAVRGISERVNPDDWVIIDSEAGLVVVNPDACERAAYAERAATLAQDNRELESLVVLPSRTLDGVMVQLLANIEGPHDVPAALRAGAQGVGLLRSEFLFMNRKGALPGEDEQYEAYRGVVQGMGGRPVTIRTVDIGADKPLGPVVRPVAANPALGLRAIRWSLADPEMFRTQLRAILRAAVLGPVKLLFPMVSHQEQLDQALAQLQIARDELAARKVAAGDVQVGAMVEVPAAALLADEFLRCVDFLSIGTNDLIQYTLAIDRTDESVAYLYTPTHPAVLRLVASVIASAERAGKEVAICGEMAGDVQTTRLLLGLGLKSFSMQPSQIPRVKQQLVQSDVAALKAWANAVVHSAQPHAMLAQGPSV